MKMRFAWALATTLVLAVLLVMSIHAGMERRLVTVSYEGWGQLQQLASWGLQIINYQGDVLAALCHDDQIEALREASWIISGMPNSPMTIGTSGNPSIRKMVLKV